MGRGDDAKIEKTDMMIRWMCGVSPRERTDHHRTAKMNGCACVEGMGDIMVSMPGEVKDPRHRG